MSSEFYIPLKSDSGIQRDGTVFDSSMHISGSMTRFYRSRPQKIGGWKLIQAGNLEIVRNMYNYDSDASVFLYLGRASRLSYIQVFSDLSTSSDNDCTPAGFAANVNNEWVFDTVTYSTIVDDVKTDTIYILATAAPDLIDIGNSNQQPMYYGVLGQTAPFLPMVNSVTTLNQTTSGGMVVLSSFILVYGDGGIIYWNTGVGFTTWPNTAFFQLGTSKFIYAAPIRSGQSVSALFWSLNSLAQGTLNPSATDKVNFSDQFLFSYISTRITVMSPKSIVSLDPCFYWVGSDSFWMWNGAVQELPNTVNKRWFFDNINPNQTGKTFGFANTKWSEIWFVFCKGDAIEPNWALVYNIDNGSSYNTAWFDTDQINRSAAVPSGSIIPYPLMSSSVPVQNGGNSVYPIYVHEYGVDAVEFFNTSPITAYIQSSYINLWAANAYSVNAKVAEIDTVILDVVQTGQMYFYISYLGYPNSTVRQSDNFNFSSSTEFLTTRVRGSIFSITFVSNTVGGDYVMGNTMLKMLATDDQRPGPTT